jgi:hypothetical protein
LVLKKVHKSEPAEATHARADRPHIQLYTYQASAAFCEHRPFIVMQASPSLMQENFDALAPGSTLQNGALAITRILAVSHFAITYVARDETLQREVAVKEFFRLALAALLREKSLHRHSQRRKNLTRLARSFSKKHAFWHSSTTLAWWVYTVFSRLPTPLIW